MPVTDIVRTGDKALVPQEGMRKASGGKVRFHMPIANGCSTCLTFQNSLPACAMKQLLLEQCGLPHSNFEEEHQMMWVKDCRGGGVKCTGSSIGFRSELVLHHMAYYFCLVH